MLNVQTIIKVVHLTQRPDLSELTGFIADYESDILAVAWGEAADFSIFVRSPLISPSVWEAVSRLNMYGRRVVLCPVIPLDRHGLRDSVNKCPADRPT